MNRDRRGFAPIGIALLVIVSIAILGGVFYYFHSRPSAPAPVDNNPPVVASSTTPTSTATSTPSSTTPATSYRSYLTPTSGPVGTVVTIHASGFAPTGNQVTLDGMVAGSLNGLASPDGKTLTFTVPSSLGPNCKPDQACPMYLIVVSARSYTVGVVLNGATYNIGTFTVTGGVGLQPTP